MTLGLHDELHRHAVVRVVRVDPDVRTDSTALGRAAKPCNTPACHHLQPCPEHTPPAWAGSTRRREPRNDLPLPRAVRHEGRGVMRSVRAEHTHVCECGKSWRCGWSKLIIARTY